MNDLQQSAGHMFDSMSTGALLASLLWGSIGSGMVIYGWKQRAMVALGGGLALVAVSYFMLDSALWMSTASTAIIGAMIWFKKMGW